MKRRALAATAAAMAAFGIGAAGADAHTYCVEKPGCPQADTFVSLQSALNTASVNLGDDRIEIGAATVQSAGGFSYAGGSFNHVDIVGAGRDQTHVLETQDGTFTTLTLTNATVSELEVVGPAPTTFADKPIALDLTEGDAHDVTLTRGMIGARLGDGAALRRSAVAGSGFGSAHAAVDVYGSGVVVEDTSVDAGSAHSVEVEPGAGSPRISRSRLNGAYGIYAGGTSLTVDETLISAHIYEGVYAYSGSAFDTDVSLVNDTIVGGPSSTGVVSVSTGAGHFTSVSIENSAIAGFQASLFRYAIAGTAALAASHSAFDASTASENGFGSLEISDANIGAPTGLDADLRPTAGSPLIDAGKSDPTGGLPATVVTGSPRAVDGDGDGSALPDIGAFEYAPPAPFAPGTPSPPVATPPAPAPLVLSKVSFAPKRFATRRPLHAARRGTRIRFALSADAKLRVSFQRGHRKAGSITLRGRQGSDSKRFAGKVNGQALKPGRYVATAVATDASGRHSVKRTARFTVVR